MRRAPRWLGIALAATALAAGADGPPTPAAIDPAAQLPAGGSASEYWDLVAQLDDGFRVAARFTITNEGPGERSAAAFGHVLRPGGAPVAFQNGRREGRWKLSPDRRRIEIGSSLLDLGDAARHFEVDNDKRGVKLFLDWQADASARSVPKAALPGGYRVDLLQLASPVRASIQVAGMPVARRLEGTLALTHTWMPVPEGELILHRIDVTSLEAGDGTYLLDLRAPAGARFAWLSQTRKETPARAWSGLEVRMENAVNASAYPIPQRLVLSAPGLHGAVSFGETLLEVDPLDALPAFLRMVYSLRGRPHRSWTHAQIELSLVPGPELPAIRVTGDAIAALTFLDALPQSPTLP